MPRAARRAFKIVLSCLLYTSAGGCTGLAGHAGIGVVGQNFVQNGIRDPVSYTHLDVYKRQVQTRKGVVSQKLFQSAEGIGVAHHAAQAAGKALGAVSYTHLDVYKRQLLNWAISALAVLGPMPGISVRVEK